MNSKDRVKEGLTAVPILYAGASDICPRPPGTGAAMSLSRPSRGLMMNVPKMKRAAR
jgi:hypothetical protein